MIYIRVMAPKWPNRNLPGALHYVTGSFLNRLPVFTQEKCCLEFFDILAEKRLTWPFKLIAYVLMPDHFHFIVNPQDGRIRELAGVIKGGSSIRISAVGETFNFLIETPDPDDRRIHQVWQESFKAFPLWSEWMIWQKINYIHANPVKAKLVHSAKDYRWSSFRAMYMDATDPIAIDKDWWWPDDVRKLSVASTEWIKERVAEAEDDRLKKRIKRG
jgi:putative transposase